MSTIFEFQTSDVSRAQVLHAGFRQRRAALEMKWICVVIM